MKTKVLFVCVHNSALSQMAEALLNQICGEEFEAHSAGLAFRMASGIREAAQVSTLSGA